MKVKDFTIVPLLCPIKMDDCSACRHAGKFNVRNPPDMGTAPADYGEHDCTYFKWYNDQYKLMEEGLI